MRRARDSQSIDLSCDRRDDAPGSGQAVAGAQSVKPLAIDLFCGLGGWTEGLLAEGYEVVGFDNVRHVYGEHRYPAQLVIQDVLTLHGSQFKSAALIVASPPCQEFSYMAMPWKRAKERAAKYRKGELDVADLTRLFDAAVRIGREAGVPTVIENVRGAQEWVGRSRWAYGSYHLWGDVPALMPMTMKCGVKVGGLDWSGPNPDGRNDPRDEIKCGGDWFNGESPSDMRRFGSRSTKRKMASAMIAKIPLALARHIARVYRP
jgi:C-5 cytosine-specific DNA methylase